MTKAEAMAGAGYGLAQSNASGNDVTAEGVTLALPDGREIVTADRFTLTRGGATLVTGPSGSGKSTLFRAIAGIWPFGQGRIAVPPGQSALVLPQRPYLPLGTLRGAVVYPATTDQFSDAAIRDALVAAQLPQLADRLDEVDAWDQRLSGGEQQRVAIARAVLAKPQWLFLDESTAALDEPSEAALYRMLRERLPETTIVSIGHRSTLHALHDRRIDMRAGADGRFVPTPVTG
jgi:putative ATP-binding cassette transporter